MRITWLFGNGLDLSYGLKTSYFHFYKYLLELEEQNLITEENIIFLQLKHDFEKHNEDLWSDYETRLGELTSLISDQQIEKFENDKIQIDLLLKDYLKNEEKKLKIDEKQTSKILINSFSQLIKCSREVDNKKINELIRLNSQSPFRFKAISFNYTKTVSTLWENNENSLSDFKLNGYPQSYSSILETPFYLHGTLEDGQMIIGVNDFSQIKNEELKNSTKLSEALFKSSLLNQAGQLHLEQFTSLINETEIICTYGLSIGKTDAYYWKIIKERLLKSKSILIIYYYDKTYVNAHISLTNRITNQVKSKFYSNSEATNDEIERIKDRIIIEVNHELFLPE